MSMPSIKTMGFVLLNKKGNPLKNMPGHIFMVDNLQDCNMLIPLMDLFLPVRPTIIVTSFNAPPHHPVADHWGSSPPQS